MTTSVPGIRPDGEATSTWRFSALRGVDTGWGWSTTTRARSTALSRLHVARMSVTVRWGLSSMNRGWSATRRTACEMRDQSVRGCGLAQPAGVDAGLGGQDPLRQLGMAMSNEKRTTGRCASTAARTA